MSLDKDIPGTSTFNKPEDDKRQFDKAEPGSIYRRDRPDDMAKPQDDQKGDGRHMEEVHPEYTDPGGRPPGDQSITKYPYRGDRKYKHYASVEFVLESHLANSAPELVMSADVSDDGIKVATRLHAIEDGLNPLVTERSHQCTADLKRADIPNLRWIFAVNCGNGSKVVKVKAIRTGNVTNLSKMDLHLSCSCPAWRWLGSEHWSKGENYIDGKPRGTASEPVIRDPEGINRVCKHVAAVLSNIRKWQVGPKRQAVKTAMAKRAHEVRVAELSLAPTNQDGGHAVIWGKQPPIYVRARGGAEFKTAEFQLRKHGESWPQQWIKSSDLAGDMGLLGLDVEWSLVPEPVKAWVNSGTPVEFLHQACSVWRNRGSEK
jgi:hypothetical protein